jgi:membrane-bound acyltransferase YfiQ involved in biofilm formation
LSASNSKRLFESSAVKIESQWSQLASFVVDDEYIYLCSYLTTNSNPFAVAHWTALRAAV